MQENLIKQEDEPPSSSHYKKEDFSVEDEESSTADGSFFVLWQLLPLDLRNFYSKTALSPETLQVEIISQIDRCFELWKEFSPQKTLFDTWEFRLAFYRGYQYKPYFLLIKNQKENLALLPLWYEDDKKKYFWFGSSWQEENTFFVKDPIFISPLLNICPKPVLLNAISPSAIGSVKQLANFQSDDSKYILDLTEIESSDDYLMKLKKNRRHDLRKDKRRIEGQNPKIIIDNFSDFENLIKLSKERFKQKGEETDWEDFRRIETFRQVIKLAGESYKVRMITVQINEKIAGVDLVTIFNNCYYTLKCGYDVKNFPGIGNFVNLFEIEDALKMGMKKIDFLQNNYGWKSQYFKPVSLSKYEK